MDQPKEEAHTEEPQAKETEQTEQAPQEGGEEAPKEGGEEAPKKKGGWGSVLSAPQGYGNAAGEKIEGALGKVGGPVGKGLETAAKPVGGIVEPVVGGLFRAPQTFGHASDHAAKQEAQQKEDERPIAGEEMTAENPLGLNQDGPK